MSMQTNGVSQVAPISMNQVPANTPTAQTPAGFSDVRSSVHAHESGTWNGMWCFQWISEKLLGIFESLWSWVSSFFCSAQRAPTVDSTPQERLNFRIERGIEFIRRHLSNPILDQLDPNHSAICMLIRYNNRLLDPFSRTSEGRDVIRDGAIAHLRQLLNIESQCENGRLSIEMLVFRKHPGGGIDCQQSSISRVFGDINDTTGSGQTEILNESELREFLETYYHAGSQRVDQVMAFLAQL